MKLSLIILTLALSTTTVLGIYTPRELIDEEEIDEEIDLNVKDTLLSAAIESLLQSAKMEQRSRTTTVPPSGLFQTC